MVPLLFWLIRDWRWFGLVISLPMLLAILAHFIVPESARSGLIFIKTVRMKTAFLGARSFLCV